MCGTTPTLLSKSSYLQIYFDEEVFEQKGVLEQLETHQDILASRYAALSFMLNSSSIFDPLHDDLRITVERIDEKAQARVQPNYTANMAEHMLECYIEEAIEDEQNTVTSIEKSITMAD